MYCLPLDFYVIQPSVNVEGGCDQLVSSSCRWGIVMSPVWIIKGISNAKMSAPADNFIVKFGVL